MPITSLPELSGLLGGELSNGLLLIGGGTDRSARVGVGKTTLALDIACQAIGREDASVVVRVSTHIEVQWWTDNIRQYRAPSRWASGALRYRDPIGTVRIVTNQNVWSVQGLRPNLIVVDGGSLTREDLLTLQGCPIIATEDSILTGIGGLTRAVRICNRRVQLTKEDNIFTATVTKDREGASGASVQFAIGENWALQPASMAVRLLAPPPIERVARWQILLSDEDADL